MAKISNKAAYPDIGTPSISDYLVLTDTLNSNRTKTVTVQSLGALIGGGSASWDSITGKPSTFTPSAHTHPTSDIISGTFADARISESNVTQHEAAIEIGVSQITATGTPDLTTYLRGDGSWQLIAPPSPGGADTNIQFNNSGVLGGSADLTWDGGLNIDNIRIDGNVISSTSTNGPVIITPDGTGDVEIGGTGAGNLVKIGYNELRFGLAAGFIFSNANGDPALTVSDISSGRNAKITAPTGAVSFGAEGSDTNINIGLIPKGTGYIDVNTSLISNVTDPVSAQDAATKSWVESQISSGATVPGGSTTQVQ